MTKTEQCNAGKQSDILTDKQLDILTDKQSDVLKSILTCVFRGSVVERWSLTGELLLSCDRPTADG